MSVHSSETSSFTSETTDSQIEPEDDLTDDAMADAAEGKAVGSKCEIKSLYTHSSNPQSHRAKWSEFKDPSMEEARLKAASRSFAIIQRFSRERTAGGEYSWKTCSIEVQSPKLQATLAHIFRDYRGWNSDETPYIFFSPFDPFVHWWSKIMDWLSQEQDMSAKMEVQLLCDMLEPVLAPSFAALKRVKATGRIKFRSLWLLWAPGTLMVTGQNEHLCLSKLQTAELGKLEDGSLVWRLKMDTVDWNGSYSGFAEDSVIIPRYSEPQLVTKLVAHPLEFRTTRKEIQDQLLTRGKKFASLRGFHVVTCTGKKYIAGMASPVSGRIIVDAYAFYTCQNQVKPKLTRNPDAESASPGVPKEGSHQPSPAEKERHEERRPLTDMECMLAVPRVKGFDLKTKEWCEFDVDAIEDADWSDTAYDNLVLPDGEKELIIAFADRARYTKRGFDDFVQHKGEGIVILLCGPPGVGKTLTAEGVADKSRAPLYILSAADLGTEPKNVEKSLNKALECCHLWDAVLLLDEADVFLETRRSDSLNRNELVSIFLRRLEYYRGLMFLTTNRISAIDPAFKSRLDLILPYRNLDEPARTQVWANFVRRMAPETSTLGDHDFAELAKAPCNGREIKNLIKTALVLAARQGPLTIDHLRVVLNIRARAEHFNLDRHRDEVV